MIQIKFYSRDPFITGFEISGHCSENYEDTQGKLICSAVSSAVYLTANTLIEILKLDVKHEISDGVMIINVLNFETSECQAALNGLKLHLFGLRQQYPKQIKIDDKGDKNA